MESIDHHHRPSTFGKSARHSILRKPNFSLPAAVKASQSALRPPSPPANLQNISQPLLPLYNPPSRSASSFKHFNPYHRTPAPAPRAHGHERRQLDSGLVAGSSLNHNDHHLARQAPQEQNDGLIRKCVGWFFGHRRRSSSQDRATQTEPQPIPVEQQAPPAPSPPLADTQNTHHQLPPPPPPSLRPAPPASASSSHLLPAAPNPIPSSAPLMNPSATDPDLSRAQPAPSKPSATVFRSHSPFISWDTSHRPQLSASSSASSLNLASQSSRRIRKRPTTAHATLQVMPSRNRLAVRTSASQFFTTAQPPFLPQPSTAHPCIRSVSPFHNGAFPGQGYASSNSWRTSGAPSSSPRLRSGLQRFSPYGLATTLPRSGTQVDGLSNQLFRTRSLDQSNNTSISRKRERGDQTQGLFPCHDNEDTTCRSAKRGRFWDPEWGFVTQEQQAKLRLEAEIKLREKEGRPFPTNEAEKILEALESRRAVDGEASTAITTMPNISVPTPGGTRGRSHLSKGGQKLESSSNVAASHEERDSPSSTTIAIAPITKKLEAKRIERLDEKKGKLRAELKRRREFAEKLERAKEGVDGAEEPKAVNEDRGPVTRSRRSRPAPDAGQQPTSPRRKRCKFGKLTGPSIRAKVLGGSTLRSQSVREEQSKESSVHAAAPEFLSGAASKGSQGLKPSPLIRGRSHDSSNAWPPFAQGMKPLYKRTPAPPISSHGSRYFTNYVLRRPKVFSAREEDLPPLDEEDEQNNKENDKVSKIKVPPKLRSSFNFAKCPNRATKEPQPSDVGENPQAGPSNEGVAVGCANPPTPASLNAPAQALAPDVSPPSADPPAPVPAPGLFASFSPTTKGGKSAEPAVSSTFISHPLDAESGGRPPSRPSSRSSFSGIPGGTAIPNASGVTQPVGDQTRGGERQDAGQEPSILEAKPSVPPGLLAPSADKTGYLSAEAPPSTVPAWVANSGQDWVQSAGVGVFSIQPPGAAPSSQPPGATQSQPLDSHGSMSIPSASETQSLSAPVPTPSFGTQVNEPTTSGQAQASPVPGFLFPSVAGSTTPSVLGTGKPETSNPLFATPTFSFSMPAANTQSSSATATAPLFSSTSQSESQQPASAPTIVFGAAMGDSGSGTSSPAFSFMTTAPVAPQPAVSTSLFGNTAVSASPQVPTFTFGVTAPSPGTGGAAPSAPSNESFSTVASRAPNSTGSFSFGSTLANTNSTPGFVFGPNSTAPTISASPFGASFASNTGQGTSSGFVFGTGAVNGNAASSSLTNSSSPFGSKPAGHTLTAQNSAGSINTTSTFSFGASGSNAGSATQLSTSSPFTHGTANVGLSSSGQATTTSLFGNSSHTPANGASLFGDNIGVGAGPALSGSSVPATLGITTNSIGGMGVPSTPVFGASLGINFGNAANGAGMGSGASFGESSTPTPFSFGTGVGTASAMSHPGSTGNNNHAAINPPSQAATPAPGGFVFNMGSSADKTVVDIGPTRRVVRKLPSSMRKKR